MIASIYLLQPYVFINIELLCGAVQPHFEIGHVVFCGAHCESGHTAHGHVSSIPLQDGEVTPVEAWDYIRQQEQFAGLEVERWGSLKDKLMRYVRCHGFGAVIEREAFENAVFEAFVVGRVF